MKNDNKKILLIVAAIVDKEFGARCHLQQPRYDILHRWPQGFRSLSRGVLPGGPDAEVSAALHQERPPPIRSVSVEFDNGTVTLADFPHSI